MKPCNAIFIDFGPTPCGQAADGGPCHGICLNYDTDETRNKLISPSELERIVKLTDFGRRNSPAVVLTGPDPLIFERLLNGYLSVLERIPNHRSKYLYTTGEIKGELPSDDIVKRIGKSGVNVSLSLTRLAITQTPFWETYLRRYLKLIEKLTAEKVPVTALLILSKRNISNIPKVYKALAEYGVELNLQPFVVPRNQVNSDASIENISKYEWDNFSSEMEPWYAKNQARRGYIELVQIISTTRRFPGNISCTFPERRNIVISKRENRYVVSPCFSDHVRDFMMVFDQAELLKVIGNKKTLAETVDKIQLAATSCHPNMECMLMIKAEDITCVE